jgi:hypothetical protein
MNPQFKHKGKFILYPLFALAFILAAGYAVMFLWNAILPEVIPAVGKVTFMQAAGLLILCRILFGGFKGGGGYGKQSFKNNPEWKEKMMNMSEEDREKFKSEWRSRCGQK